MPPTTLALFCWTGPMSNSLLASSLSRAQGETMTSTPLGLMYGSASTRALVPPFSGEPEKGIEILEMEWVDRGSKTPGKLKLRPGMTHAEIASVLPMHFPGRFHDWEEGGLEWMVARERCFLKLEARSEDAFPAISIPAAGLL